MREFRVDRLINSKKDEISYFDYFCMKKIIEEATRRYMKIFLEMMLLMVISAHKIRDLILRVIKIAKQTN